MLIEVSKEELEIIKSALSWAIYWIENKENLKNLNSVLSVIDRLQQESEG